MHPMWFREIRDACAEHEIPLHGKQWGSYAPSEPSRADYALEPNGMACAPNLALPSPDVAWMRYMGAAPTSGGKILDGVDHCEFPSR